MDETSDLIVTRWGDYDIAVTVKEGTVGSIPDGIISSYEIFRAGELLAFGSVPATYSSRAVAAASALRIAKLDARESLPGPFPVF